MVKKTSPAPRAAAAEAACPECGGTGYVLEGDSARPCACLRARHAEKHLARANIPPRFSAKTLDAFQAKTRVTRDIRQAADAYLSQFSHKRLAPSETSRTNGLLFIGGVGSGKTHVAVALLRALIERGFSGRYWNVVDLLDDLRASFDPNSPQAGWEIIDEIVSTHILVLDDLGAEAPTGWVLDRLYQIVNRRYEENRPTIVTTNLTLEELERQVGPRITSRLCEMCSAVEFPDRDWRRAHMQG